MRVRTRAGELMELWFTRRLMVRLWNPLQHAADRASLRGVSPGSTVHPEAQDMMTRAMRQKSRQAGDFGSPFDESFTGRPLGDLPMLVHAVDIQDGGAGKPVTLKFRDAAKREVSLDVGTDLLLNLIGLMEHALAQSEWGLKPKSPSEAPDAPAASSGSQRLLN